MMTNIAVLPWIFLSVLGVSLISFVGIFLLSIRDDIVQKILQYLVSFATGALFGNVFMHLLPEVIEETKNLSTSLMMVFVGILFSFVIEKFIHWHHCHSLECSQHIHPVGNMILFGDAAHNVLDGMLIAVAYLADMQLGIAVTLTVILHEIPQEIGDFSILLHSGYSRVQALVVNFLSALTAFAGVAIVLFLRGHVDNIEEVLLPLTAGNFLYIAGADLIPALHKETRATYSLLQLACIIAGASLLYSL